MRSSLAAVSALTLLAAPAAQATYDPLGSGQTKLILDKGFASLLGRDGISLTGVAGARKRAKTVSLPVIDGNFDPTLGKGEIDTEGTIVFQNERKRVPLREIVVRTKHSPLIAKVGGSQLKVASAAKLSSEREGFGSSFQARQLRLTAKVATRLNKKLRPRLPFAEGQAIGTLTSQTQPLTTAILERNKATLVFDPGFVAKLNSLFVSMNPIFPAEHQGSTFTFPIIVGGALAPDGSQGTLRTGGDVELLQLGGGQIFWHELWLDLEARVDSAEANVQPSPPYAGKTGRIGLFDANLSAASVSPDPGARTISVASLPLTLQAQTAKTLSEAFAGGEEDFTAGEAVGAVSFTAQGQ